MVTLNYYNYYTEIEEHFAKRRGKHLWVSPLDWSLIEVWKEAGIPLNVALRGIDRAFDHFHARPKKSQLVTTLFYCHPAVLQAFEESKEALVGSSPAERADLGSTLPSTEEAAKIEMAKLTAWLNQAMANLRQCGERAEVEGRSRSLETIRRVLNRLDELLVEVTHFHPQGIPYERIERDLTLLDRLLIEAAQSEIPEDLHAAWLAEAKPDLKVYKRNLPKETYKRILENFISKKIHMHFELPALSLFFL